ncbi:MAG: hypothetical protein SFV15_05710 [Polyangiaceae bacterium]|nr:hypothetical protein [Polyangiaceae bacterium]
MKEESNAQLKSVTPIVKVTKIADGMSFFMDVLGFQKDWQCGTFGCVKAFVQERKKPLETVLRRVVREELRRAQGAR